MASSNSIVRVHPIDCDTAYRTVLELHCSSDGTTRFEVFAVGLVGQVTERKCNSCDDPRRRVRTAQSVAPA